MQARQARRVDAICAKNRRARSRCRRVATKTRSKQVILRSYEVNLLRTRGESFVLGGALHSDGAVGPPTTAGGHFPSILMQTDTDCALTRTYSPPLRSVGVNFAQRSYSTDISTDRSVEVRNEMAVG